MIATIQSFELRQRILFRCDDSTRKGRTVAGKIGRRRGERGKRGKKEIVRLSQTLLGVLMARGKKLVDAEVRWAPAADERTARPLLTSMSTPVDHTLQSSIVTSKVHVRARFTRFFQPTNPLFPAKQRQNY